MKIVSGNPQNPRFNERLRRLVEEWKDAQVIVADGISCHEARNIIIRSSSNRSRPWLIDSLKQAIAHLIVCERQQCRNLFQGLEIKVS
jgi:hypothetical protein